MTSSKKKTEVVRSLLLCTWHQRACNNALRWPFDARVLYSQLWSRRQCGLTNFVAFFYYLAIEADYVQGSPCLRVGVNLQGINLQDILTKQFTTILVQKQKNYSYRFVVRSAYIPLTGILCKFSARHNSRLCEITVSSVYISSFKFSEQTSASPIAHIDRQVRGVPVSVLVTYEYLHPVFALIINSADNRRAIDMDLWNCIISKSEDGYVGCATELLQKILSFALPTYCKFI